MLASMDEDRTWLDHCTDIQLLQRLGVHLPDEPWFQGDPSHCHWGPTPAPCASTPPNSPEPCHRPTPTCATCRSAPCPCPNTTTACNRPAPSHGSTLKPPPVASNASGQPPPNPSTWSWTATADAPATNANSTPAGHKPTLTSKASHPNSRTTRSHSMPAHCTCTSDPKADADHLPVALASMAAKLVRELLMQRLNRFFTERMPDLAPTAGYVQDGRRWLQEVDPVLQDAGFQTDQLVRCR